MPVGLGKQDRLFPIQAFCDGREFVFQGETACALVSISTEHDPEMGVARILFADTGPGIPPEEREKLFMPYYSTKRRGSGLGLAIVSRLVAEHRGRVRLEENVPHGSVFIIELPIDPTPSAPSPAEETGDPAVAAPESVRLTNN